MNPKWTFDCIIKELVSPQTWQSRRICAHFPSGNHQNHNQVLNSHRPKRLESTPPDTFKDKKPHEMVGGVLSQHSQILCPPGGQPIGWKVIMSQRFPHKIKCWAPHHAPQHEGPALRGGSPEHLALKVSGDWVQDWSSTGLGETESTLGGHRQGFVPLGASPG